MQSKNTSRKSQKETKFLQLAELCRGSSPEPPHTVNSAKNELKATVGQLAV